MKKISIKVLLVFAIFYLTLNLFSCVASSSLLYAETTKPKKIELINYNNQDVKNNPSEKGVFNENLIEVIEELNTNQLNVIDNFGKEFNLRVHSPMNRKQFLFSHNGIGLRFVYDDKSFQIVTLTEISNRYYFFVGLYNADGTQIQSKDADGSSLYETFKDIINKHFTKEIEF